MSSVSAAAIEVTDIRETARILRNIVLTPERLQLIRILAEAVRFELTKGVNPGQFSRLVHSTALPHLQRLLQHREMRVLVPTNLQAGISLHCNASCGYDIT